MTPADSSHVSPMTPAEVPPLVVRDVAVPRGAMDVPLLVLVGLLVSIGLFEIYIASGVSSRVATSQMMTQAWAALVGVGVMLVVSRIDYRVYRTLAVPLFVGSLVLVSLTLVGGLGDDAKGAARWLVLGPLRFQPSEMLKFASVVFVAAWIVRKDRRIQKFVDGLMGLGLIVVVQTIALMKQPDFGTTLLVTSTTILLLIVGGASLRNLFGTGLAALTAASIFLFAEDYRRNRVLAWLNPFDESVGASFQLRASLIALARGGLEGTGLADARSHLGYVPELHNDFVATAIGEQFGLMGFAVLLAMYLAIFGRCLMISRRAPDRFGMLLAMGLGSMICIQALFHLGVANGTFPTKGLTLPFVSYGRTSLLVLFAMLGVLLNIGQANEDVDEVSEQELDAACAERDEQLRRQRAMAVRLRDVRRRHGARG